MKKYGARTIVLTEFGERIADDLLNGRIPMHGPIRVRRPQPDAPPPDDKPAVRDEP